MKQQQQQQLMQSQQQPAQQQQLQPSESATSGLGQTQFQPPGVMPPSGLPASKPEPAVEARPEATLPNDNPNEDDEFFSSKKQGPKKLEPFKLFAANASRVDEWESILPKLATYDWSACPVRLIPLTPKVEGTAKELLAARDFKGIVEFGESFVRDGTSESMYNLDFGFPGTQVPINTDLKQKIVLAAGESHKFSFKVIKRRHPKYRINAEPLEGTLSKGQSAVEITITLKMACTTSVELQIPIIFWHGNLKDYDRMVGQATPTDKQVFVGYLRGKMQSQLSTRLDIEEVLLYKPAIGNGAYGTVYKGRYRGLDVACKLLKDQDNLTQDMLEDFKSEVNMFEIFRHPCIVNFIGAVFFPGSLALVTELCQYGSLPSAMEKYPKVWDTKMKIKAMFDCARAMDFLHQSSIIHRDLKPDNLLATSLEVHSPAVCKLSDFGTTKGANSMMREMKMTKGIGTPLFMAPEMMRATEGYTTKADVYSFGIMMASVADNGKEPYQKDPRIQSSWQFTNLVIGDPTRGIRGIRPIVTNKMIPEYIALMERCWDGDPTVRPTFDKIAAELEQMLLPLLDE